MESLTKFVVLVLLMTVSEFSCKTLFFADCVTTNSLLNVYFENKFMQLQAIPKKEKYNPIFL